MTNTWNIVILNSREGGRLDHMEFLPNDKLIIWKLRFSKTMRIAYFFSVQWVITQAQFSNSVETQTSKISIAINCPGNCNRLKLCSEVWKLWINDECVQSGVLRLNLNTRPNNVTNVRIRSLKRKIMLYFPPHSWWNIFVSYKIHFKCPLNILLCTNLAELALTGLW